MQISMIHTYEMICLKHLIVQIVMLLTLLFLFLMTHVVSYANIYQLHILNHMLIFLYILYDNYIYYILYDNYIQRI